MSRTRSLSSNKQRGIHNNLMRNVPNIFKVAHARQFRVSQYQPKLRPLLPGFVPRNTNIKRKVAHHRDVGRMTMDMRISRADIRCEKVGEGEEIEEASTKKLDVSAPDP